MTHKGVPSLLTALVAATAVVGFANVIAGITRRSRKEGFSHGYAE